MNMHWTILIGVTLLLNLVCGIIRLMKRPLAWRLLWIHLPIPFIVWMRWTFLISWRWIPLLVVVALAGQLAGGWIQKEMLT